jgi:recombination protein RecA
LEAGVAVKIKTVQSKTSMSMSDMLKTFQKDMGEDIGNFGGTLVNSDRVPTGLFPLDLALGGGFPRGRCSMIYGPESSNKTNIVLRAIAMHQLLWPDKVCAFFDIENSFDPAWAKSLGVDTDKLVVIRPTYGEQIVDMCESLLYAADCGIVAIDSLAALLTTSEAQASAERANVGSSGLLTGKLNRKTTLALAEAEKKGGMPSLIYINQTRFKMGVMYGNPETIPGGNAPKFQSNIILRVYGKNELDPKISTVMPVMKEVKFIVNKWKCPILMSSGVFRMATMAHKGLKVGQCDDFNTVSEYLKAFGKFEKDAKKGWIILETHYDVIDQFKTKIFEDKQFGNGIRNMIINKMLSTGDLLLEHDEPAGDE